VPRIRTAKTVAKRIDLQYFAKLHPFRRWRLWLSIAVPVIALGWLVGENTFRGQHVYNSGPLSSAHAVFGDQCALCHVRTAGFSAPVEDKTCLSCHNAPVHNQKQTFIPACSSCHVEHKGRMRLAATADTACTQCHSDLKTKDGSLSFQAHISGFDSGHPQFAALRPGQSDPGTIRLNHWAHLQPTIAGPNGNVQMQCYDCHRPLGTNEPWPYSVAATQPASQQPLVVGQDYSQQRKRRSVEAGPGAYLTPIRYVNQCAACHVLQFDPLIKTPAPHAQPEYIHQFIVQSLTQYIAANPSALNVSPTDLPPEGVEPIRNFTRSLGEGSGQGFLRRSDDSEPQRAGALGGKVRAQSASDWVQRRTGAAEKLLWAKNCRICHALTEGGGNGLPTVVKAIVPVRWFPHAEFDHESHRMMKCTACHTNIPQSKNTSDVNVPGIEICRDCHKEKGPSGAAAVGGCYECHSYHDWRNEQRVQGRVDIAQVRGKGPVAPPLSTPNAAPENK
jgi:hypothetical protein